MTLASQSARTVQAQRTMSRRAKMSRGSKRRLLTASVLCLVLAAIGTIVLWQTRVFDAGSGDDVALSQTRDTDLPADPLARPTPTPQPQPPARVSSATTLEMGGGRTPSTTTPPSTPTPPTPANPAPVAVDPVTTPAVIPGGSTPAINPSPTPANTPTTVTPPPQPQPATNTQPPELTSPVAGVLTSAERAQAQGKLIEARDLYTQVILDNSANASQQQTARQQAAAINDKLIFSKHIEPGDTLVDTYTVQSGDNLVKIARKAGMSAEHTLIARINGMADPNRLSVGQKLKIVRGPFHAIVDKSDFRMDVFIGERPVPGSRSVPRWTYIRSFKVGLGEGGSTPLGLFAVRENSKLVNPHWVNPRTGEKFDRNDPANPIGERWIGLVGQETGNASAAGYGIHGTIEPDSIGREMSMGCVRMAGPDVETVYDLLVPTISTVTIRP